MIKKGRLEFNKCLKNLIKNYFSKKKGGVILVDAMWDNPYHFLRLLIVKFAMNETIGGNLIGIINSETKIETLKTFKSLGIKKIFNTQENIISKKYIKKAKRIIKNKKKFNKIKLPFNYPSYFLKDDICKRFKDPNIDLNDYRSLRFIAKALHYLDYYKKVIKNNKIKCAVLSHQVTIRYSSLIWILLKKKIPVYILHYINGHITCRKIKNTKQLTNVTDDYLSYNKYKKLKTDKVKYFINVGKKYFDEVKKNKLGEFKFINVYKKQEYLNKTAFLKTNNLNEKNKNVFIYANCWTDFPNCYGRQWYEDYIDWFKFTIKVAAKNKKCNWIIKPHPAEKQYGNLVTAKKIVDDFLSKNPSIKNIKVAENLSGNDTIEIADTIITTIGTGAIELACSNVGVIYCGKSIYSDYKFGFFAKNKKIYNHVLLNLHKMKLKKNKKQALFFFGMMLADNPKFNSYPYNNLGQTLYLDIENFVKKNQKKIFLEVEYFKKWIYSKEIGYNTFKNFYF